MAAGTLEILRCVPGPDAWTAYLESRVDREENLQVTTFDDRRICVLREVADCDGVVETFPKIVEDQLRLCGVSWRPVAAGDHVEAALRLAAGRLDEDDPLRDVERFAGTRRAVEEAVDDLALAGWTPEALETAAGGELWPEDARRLRSLARLWREGDETLALVHRERHSVHLRRCLDATPDWGGNAPRLVVFLGGPYRPLRALWLRWLVACGGRVTVVAERHAGAARGMFEDDARYVEALGVAAREVGAGGPLAPFVFADVRPEGESSLAVEVVPAPDPLAECEAALRTALRLGPANTAILARNLATYGPLLEASARRLGVELAMSRRAPLAANPLVRLGTDLFSALAAETPDALLAIPHTERTPLPAKVRRAIRAGVEGTDDPWAALADVPDLPDWLARALAWRADHAEPRDLAGWFRAFCVLLDPYSEAARGRHGGDPWTARDRRALRAFEGRMKAEAAIFALDPEANPFLDRPTYAAHLREWMADGDHTVPCEIHGLAVASSEIEIGAREHLVVLGCLEGTFPKRRKEHAVLDDALRSLLSRRPESLGPLPDSHDGARREREEFYRIACHATRSLVLAYPTVRGESESVPTQWIEAVVEATRPDAARRRGLPAAPWLPDAREEETEADARLRRALDGEPDVLPEVVLRSERATEIARLPDGEPMTPRQIRTAAECSFHYVASYRLTPRPGASRDGWYELRRLPERAALAAAPDRETAVAWLREAFAELRATWRTRRPDWEVRLLSEAADRLIPTWAEREFRARALWPGTDAAFDVPFGDHGTNDLGGRFGVAVRGRFARVARFGRYRVGLLYEKGITRGDDLDDAKRLYLQVLFRALWTNDEVVPALEFEDGGADRVLLLMHHLGGVPQDSGNGLKRYCFTEMTRSAVELPDFDRHAKSEVERDFWRARRGVFGLTAQERAAYPGLAAKDAGLAPRLSAVLTTVREGAIAARPGDPCDRCDYAEICRSGRGTAEEEDPFDVV